MAEAKSVAGLSPEERLDLLNAYADSTHVGVVLSSMFYGVFIVQLYVYARGKKTRSDSIALRCLVAWVALCETAHALFLWIFYVINMRRSRFEPQRILDLSALLGLTYWIASVMGTTVQSFYGFRLYRLSGRLFTAILPWMASTARCILATIALVLSFRNNNIVDFVDQYGWSMLVVFATSALTDVFNTATLCRYLYAKRTDKRSTRRVVDSLIIWTLETGLVTTVLAVLMLVLLLVGRYYLVPGFVHIYPNLFSLSFMISLNFRDTIRRRLSAQMNVVDPQLRDVGTSIAFATDSKPPVDGQGGLRSVDRHPTRIIIHTETIELPDVSPSDETHSDGIIIDGTRSSGIWGRQPDTEKG